ncbi:hypothetical protein HKX48_000117 [Thoreauomyces humboldtii]|nr:hypothetical protein HKX48_000117 [Thoreauomyces humboldtii]
MTSKPIALIIGAGANIGQRVADQFVARGYLVAAAARSEHPSAPGSIHRYQTDASNPEAVAALVHQVAGDLGAPSVVIYNAASRITSPDPLADPLLLSHASASLAVSTLSPLAAAQATYQEWQKAGITKGTFIFTGNILNVTPLPGVMTFGMAKSATAHMVRSFADTYGDKGFKFYYADERTEAGTPAFLDRDGDAHASLYVDLAADPKQRVWWQTFVKGRGYVEFPVTLPAPSKVDDN